MLVLNLPAFENKKYTAYDCFHGKGPYGEIPTKKEPIRTFGFPSRLPFHIFICCIRMVPLRGSFQHFRRGSPSFLYASRCPREVGKGDLPARNRSVLLQDKAASV